MPDGYIEQRYSKTPVRGLVENTLDYFCEKVDRPIIGDILLLTFLHNPCHVVFYAGQSIIHAYEERGRVVEDAYETKWQKRYLSTYRVKQ